MNKSEILSKCDHTILKQTATFSDVKETLDQGIACGAASCCISPCFVKQAKEYVGDKIKICTVIGFPNGNSLSAVKAYETELAVADGADEIDMVINTSYLRDNNLAAATADVKAVREKCIGKVLKVIIETCLLTDDEKRLACRAVIDGGADFVKTSTGFSSAGATIEDVRLLKQEVGDKIKVKAAGGIRDFDFAEKLIAAGADRIGESKLAK